MRRAPIRGCRGPPAGAVVLDVRRVRGWRPAPWAGYGARPNVVRQPLRRLGVLGWPVGHSRSPAMHEAAFRALGLDGWRYQKLPVPPDLLADTLAALPRSGFVGANVTVPHKELALVLADEASGTAAAVGAANTLTFKADGTIAAENTDVPGLLAALPTPVEGRRVLVLGAGGSARAAVFALATAGASEVSVLNRTHARAVDLAASLQARAVEAPEAADVLVNCTSVGLGDPDAMPVDEAVLDSVGAVVDLVYRAGGTALIRAARERGLPCADGLEVLVQQGARSFTLWTDREAPVEEMRAAVAD